jgi:hypothetical protein
VINAIITTHDGYGLSATLQAIAKGTKLPDRIVVTCDGIDATVDRTVAQFSKQFPGPLVYVRRQHKGRARRSQTRNNGVRALGTLSPDDVLFFLDGHILLGAHHFQILSELSHYDVILSCFRQGSRTLSEQISGLGPLRGRHQTSSRLSPDLWVRSIKIAAQKLLRDTDRACGTDFAQVWWPSLCSANFAVKYGVYKQVNGFDEAALFEDWTPEDDDLGRRLYAVGATICNATVRLAGFHLWHTSDRQERLRQVRSTLQQYFTGPIEAHYGLCNPRDQEHSEVKVDISLP